MIIMLELPLNVIVAYFKKKCSPVNTGENSHRTDVF